MAKDILYGVKFVELLELDPKTQDIKEDGVRVVVDTAESVEMEAVINEGAEETQRSDTKILAVVSTPDLLYGYDVTFTDNSFDPEIGALLAGGTVTRDANGNLQSFRMPKLSEGAGLMKPFAAHLYVANYQGDQIINYIKIKLNKCTGQYPAFTFGKEFTAPEWTFKAREATAANKPIIDFEYVDELPQASAPVIISSKVGTFKFGDTSITNIPAQTTAGALLNGLYVSYNGSKKIVDKDGKERTNEVVVATDKVVIYDITNPEELKTEYTLTLTGAK